MVFIVKNKNKNIIEILKLFFALIRVLYRTQFLRFLMFCYRIKALRELSPNLRVPVFIRVKISKDPKLC